MTLNQKRIRELEGVVTRAHAAIREVKPSLLALDDFYTAWRKFDDAMSSSLFETDAAFRESVANLKIDVVLKADAVRMIIKK